MEMNYVMLRIFLLVCAWLPFLVAVKSQNIAHQPITTDTFLQKPVRNHFRYELVGVTDNDNYTLQLRDGYYTNGLFFTFLWAAAPTNPSRAEKIVHGIEIGQQIFNPIRFDKTNISDQDRPFAGYLFAKYHHKKALNNGAMFGWNASIGTIGPASGAENVQRWYHGLIGIYDVEGWPTQLHNEWNFNLGTQYAKSIVKGKSTDVSMLAEGQIGNAFTGAMGGLLLRLGQFEQHGRSVHWYMRSSTNGKGAPVNKSETYIYFQPSLTFQGYYAVLQGGLFTSDKGPFTTNIQPLVYSHQIGIKHAQNRMSFALCYVQRGKQATTQIRKENFVSIQLAYRFGEYTFNKSY